MKIRTPSYYKNFKCIAGDCEDTCCAGWDVDVDEAAYKKYKKVKGEIGEKLKRVMVPEKEGGCTFTLTKNKRCPFLNEDNLCELIINLGEESLCETCDEFPRFINVYGSEKEIGIAPSCKTAGELIFSYKEPLTFDNEEDGNPVTTYNDIDPELYFALRQARVTAYNIMRNRNFNIADRVYLYLEFAGRLQKKLNKDQIYLFDYENSLFSDEEELRRLLKTRKNYNAENDRDNCCIKSITAYFESFRGMEVINPDWHQCQRDVRKFSEKYDTDEKYKRVLGKFLEYYSDKEYEFEQLEMYYIYRYFLDAVNDSNILLKAKLGVTGYIILRHLDLVRWDKNGGKLDFLEQVDMAHLYSRQLEHSYYNFVEYCDFFNRKRRYSVAALMRILTCQLPIT